MANLNLHSSTALQEFRSFGCHFWCSYLQGGFKKKKVKKRVSEFTYQLALALYVLVLVASLSNLYVWSIIWDLCSNGSLNGKETTHPTGGNEGL